MLADLWLVGLEKCQCFLDIFLFFKKRFTLEISWIFTGDLILTVFFLFVLEEHAL